MIGKTNCYIFSQMPKGTPLSELTEGTLVKANEVGAPVEFYLAKHDYEPGLNGDGRQLIVRKDVYDQRQWHTSYMNAWASCSMLSWLNSTYLNLLDPGLRELIGTTKYYYTPGYGYETVTSRSDAVLLLSFTELGLYHTHANAEGSALPIANTLKIAYQNGSATTQWTRSPYKSTTDTIWYLNSDGGDNADYGFNPNGSRPTFTLPADVRVDDDLHIIVA